MKHKHFLSITFLPVLFACMGAAIWLGPGNVITIHPDGTIDQAYPDWLVMMSSVVFGVGFFVLLSLVFVPFDRSRHSLPVWFLARWFVPALFLLWSLIGSKFPFSPHQLTHVLPAFLLGAAAWQKLVADFRAAPPEAPAGRAPDGELPPDPGIFA